MLPLCFVLVLAQDLPPPFTYGSPSPQQLDLVWPPLNFTTVSSYHRFVLPHYEHVLGCEIKGADCKAYPPSLHVALDQQEVVKEFNCTVEIILRLKSDKILVKAGGTLLVFTSVGLSFILQSELVGVEGEVGYYAESKPGLIYLGTQFKIYQVLLGIVFKINRTLETKQSITCLNAGPDGKVSACVGKKKYQLVDMKLAKAGDSPAFKLAGAQGLDQTFVEGFRVLEVDEIDGYYYMQLRRQKDSNYYLVEFGPDFKVSLIERIPGLGTLTRLDQRTLLLSNSEELKVVRTRLGGQVARGPAPALFNQYGLDDLVLVTQFSDDQKSGYYMLASRGKQIVLVQVYLLNSQIFCHFSRPGAYEVALHVNLSGCQQNQAAVCRVKQPVRVVFDRHDESLLRKYLTLSGLAAMFTVALVVLSRENRARREEYDRLRRLVQEQEVAQKQKDSKSLDHIQQVP